MPAAETMDFALIERDLLAAAETVGLTNPIKTAKIRNMSAKPKKAVTTAVPPTGTPTSAPASMKELFNQRDSTKPGSKEEDQAVDRIMEAMFPGNNSHASR